MRSALYIFVALLLGVAVAFGIFTVYNNHEEPLPMDKVTYIELKLDGNTFSGCFRSELKSRAICGIDYEVVDGNLYIEIIGTASGKKALNKDEDGYVALKIDGLPKISKVYFLDDEKKVPLNVN